jgi:hypothetical protein
MAAKDNTPGNLLIKERDPNHDVLDLAQTSSTTEADDDDDEEE